VLSPGQRAETAVEEVSVSQSPLSDLAVLSEHWLVSAPGANPPATRRIALRVKYPPTVRRTILCVGVRLLAEQMVQRTGGPRSAPIGLCRCGTGRGRDRGDAPPLLPNACPAP